MTRQYRTISARLRLSVSVRPWRTYRSQPLLPYSSIAVRTHSAGKKITPADPEWNMHRVQQAEKETGQY